MDYLVSRLLFYGGLYMLFDAIGGHWGVPLAVFMMFCGNNLLQAIRR